MEIARNPGAFASEPGFEGQAATRLALLPAARDHNTVLSGQGGHPRYIASA